MTDIELRNENGKIVRLDTKTGEKIPVSFEYLESVDLNNTTYISTTDSYSEVNNVLSSSGLVVFRPGTHAYPDRLEITSTDVRIIILPGATLTFEDTASSTAVDRGNGTVSPLVFASGYDDVEIRNHGTIDGNVSNFNDSVPLFLDAAKNCSYDGLGGQIINCADGMWWVDLDQSPIKNVTSNNMPNATIVCEGCHDCDIENIYAANGGEALDINYGCNNVIATRIWGRNLDGQVAEINTSPNCTLKIVREHGGCDQMVRVDDGKSGAKFSNRSETGSDNCTVEDVVGETSSRAIFVKAQVSIQDLSIRNIDVESTGARAVDIFGEADNVLDGLSVSGKAVASDTDKGYTAWSIGDGNYEHEGLDLDIVGHSAGDTGVRIVQFHDVHGSVTASDCSQNGLELLATGTQSVKTVNLTVELRDSSKHGFTTLGGGTQRDIYIDGVAIDNGTDIVLNDVFDIRVEARHGSLKRKNNPTRCVVNGWGVNDGNPSAGGQWNGNAREGVMIRDTTNGNNYVYVNGGWNDL